MRRLLTPLARKLSVVFRPLSTIYKNIRIYEEVIITLLSGSTSQIFETVSLVAETIIRAIRYFYQEHTISISETTVLIMNGLLIDFSKVKDYVYAKFIIRVYDAVSLTSNLLLKHYKKAFVTLSISEIAILKMSNTLLDYAKSLDYLVGRMTKLQKDAVSLISAKIFRLKYKSPKTLSISEVTKKSYSGVSKFNTLAFENIQFDTFTKNL